MEVGAGYKDLAELLYLRSLQITYMQMFYFQMFF